MDDLTPAALTSLLLASAWISARIAVAAGFVIWIAGATIARRARRPSPPVVHALPGAGARALAQFAALLAGGALAALTRDEAARWLPAWGQGAVCAAAALCALLGGMLGAWAARTLGAALVLPAEVRAGDPLVTTGPFAIVRHPFYLSLALWAAGAGLALGSLSGTLGLFVAVLATSASRARLEDTVLARAHPAAFADYARRVRAFFPRI
ncbi:MAG: methyltransferase [Candidatus Eisenbacteria bacterium]